MPYMRQRDECAQKEISKVELESPVWVIDYHI